MPSTGPQVGAPNFPGGITNTVRKEGVTRINNQVNETQKADTGIPLKMRDPKYVGPVVPLNPEARGKPAEPSKFPLKPGTKVVFVNSDPMSDVEFPIWDRFKDAEAHNSMHTRRVKSEETQPVVSGRVAVNVDDFKQEVKDASSEKMDSPASQTFSKPETPVSAPPEKETAPTDSEGAESLDEKPSGTSACTSTDEQSGQSDEEVPISLVAETSTATEVDGVVPVRPEADDAIETLSDAPGDENLPVAEPVVGEVDKSPKPPAPEPVAPSPEPTDAIKPTPATSEDKGTDIVARVRAARSHHGNSDGSSRSAAPTTVENVVDGAKPKKEKGSLFLQGCKFALKMLAKIIAVLAGITLGADVGGFFTDYKVSMEAGSLIALAIFGIALLFFKLGKEKLWGSIASWFLIPCISIIVFLTIWSMSWFQILMFTHRL